MKKPPLSSRKRITAAALGIGLIAFTAADCLAGPRKQAATPDEAVAQAIEEIVNTREAIKPLGIVVANIYDFDQVAAQVARTELSMNDRLQVIEVKPDSLAEKLGLMPGDQLIQLNSHYISKGKKALGQLEERILPAINWNAEIVATVIRDGYAQTLTTPSGNRIADAGQAWGEET